MANITTVQREEIQVDLGQETNSSVFSTQSMTEVATWHDHFFFNTLSACTLTLTKPPNPILSVLSNRGVFESVSHASLLCAVHVAVLNAERLLPPLIYLCIISRVPSISSENVSIQ